MIKPFPGYWEIIDHGMCSYNNFNLAVADDLHMWPLTSCGLNSWEVELPKYC